MKQDRSGAISRFCPEMQQQVADFIAFLPTRNAPPSSNKTPKRAKLAKEPLVGIWRNRENTVDSTARVRNLRAHQTAHLQSG